MPIDVQVEIDRKFIASEIIAGQIIHRTASVECKWQTHLHDLPDSQSTNQFIEKKN